MRNDFDINGFDPSDAASSEQAEALNRDRLEGVEFVGSGLNRPECVLCTKAGHWYSADWRGGVAHGLPDGSQRLYQGRISAERPLKPNGVALCEDGSFLLADLGDSEGGVFRLTRSGEVTPFLTEVHGETLPPSNFVVQDRQGRTWITVSTRLSPRSLAYNANCDDGFIVLADDRGARIVADGLGYTNECVIDAAGEYLYVNETFVRRLTRFKLHADGRLSDRAVVAEFGPGTFPDGLAFDQRGNLWVTSIVSNRLICIAPNGQQTIWLEDADKAHLEDVEKAWRSASMGRPQLDGIQSDRLRNVSSLAFGGADLRDGYLGCLLGEQIGKIRLPIAGLAPAHWHYDD